MHRNRPLAILLLAVGASAGLAACGGDGERLDTGGASPPEPSSTTTVPATTTTAPPEAATTTSTARRPTTTTTTRSTRSSSTTTTTPARASRPRVVVPRQGERVFAVFVATGASLDDPSFGKARSRLTALGYRASSGGDTACSRGAEEALPQLQEYSLSLEFATSADASRFAALYGPVIGTAAVNVYCTD